jgi:hypothetical protein
MLSRNLQEICEMSWTLIGLTLVEVRLEMGLEQEMRGAILY